MSLKQIEANRNNSLKSTGPKTEEGKALAKMNAMKHGILSHEVVVQGMHYRESHREFRRFRERFWQELAPAGPLEETLVEQIAANRWRWRRVLIAETGEIARSVDYGCWVREKLRLLNLRMGPGDMVSKLKELSAGVRCLVKDMEQLREDVLKEGGLTQNVEKRFGDRFGGHPNEFTNKLAEFRAVFSENPEGLETEALKAKNLKCILDYIETELRTLWWSVDRLEEREARDEMAQQAASVLPSAETVDKTLRYETMLDRQFHRAMNQLERLQRMRNGELVPPPLAVEVSQKC